MNKIMVLNYESIIENIINVAYLINSSFLIIVDQFQLYLIAYLEIQYITSRNIKSPIKTVDADVVGKKC